MKQSTFELMMAAAASEIKGYIDAANTDLAQHIRHIAERLAGAAWEDAERDIPNIYCIVRSEFRHAIDALHALAEEIDPGSGADLEAYVEATPEVGDDDTTD